MAGELGYLAEGIMRGGQAIAARQASDAAIVRAQQAQVQQQQQFETRMAETTAGREQQQVQFEQQRAQQATQWQDTVARYERQDAWKAKEFAMAEERHGADMARASAELDAILAGQQGIEKQREGKVQTHLADVWVGMAADGLLEPGEQNEYLRIAQSLGEDVVSIQMSEDGGLVAVDSRGAEHVYDPVQLKLMQRADEQYISRTDEVAQLKRQTEIAELTARRAAAERELAPVVDIKDLETNIMDLSKPSELGEPGVLSNKDARWVVARVEEAYQREDFKRFSKREMISLVTQNAPMLTIPAVNSKEFKDMTSSKGTHPGMSHSEMKTIVKNDFLRALGVRLPEVISPPPRAPGVEPGAVTIPKMEIPPEATLAERLTGGRERIEQVMPQLEQPVTEAQKQAFREVERPEQRAITAGRQFADEVMRQNPDARWRDLQRLLDSRTDWSPEEQRGLEELINIKAHEEQVEIMRARMREIRR